MIDYGTLTVEIYAPRGTDPQTPHTRDEVYVVMAGTGWFINGPDRHEFGPGDAYRIEPGHDAWVVGNEPMVSVEFQGAANYAKPS